MIEILDFIRLILMLVYRPLTRFGITLKMVVFDRTFSMSETSNLSFCFWPTVQLAKVPSEGIWKSKTVLSRLRALLLVDFIDFCVSVLALTFAADRISFEADSLSAAYIFISASKAASSAFLRSISSYISYFSTIGING